MLYALCSMPGFNRPRHQKLSLVLEEPYAFAVEKRGQGLEYCTLYVMIRELSAVSHQLSAGDKEKLHKIKKLLMPFTEKAKQLLILERHAMQNGHITPP